MRRRIPGGEYPGNSQPRQEAFSREFGISRIPFREALVQLESEGWSRSYPTAAPRWRSFRSAKIEALFGLRVPLDPRLLQASAPYLTPADFAELILSDYSTELRGHRIARWGELNTSLHAVLYRRAEPPRTYPILEELSGFRSTVLHPKKQNAPNSLS